MRNVKRGSAFLLFKSSKIKRGQAEPVLLRFVLLVVELR
jgi:hypothetical protein